MHILNLCDCLLQVSSVFSPGNFQGFALVNRQRTNRISTGFTVEVSTEGTQLSYSNFDYLGQEPHYWQLPEVFQGDKVSFKEHCCCKVRGGVSSSKAKNPEMMRHDLVDHSSSLGFSSCCCFVFLPTLANLSFHVVISFSLFHLLKTCNFHYFNTAVPLLSIPFFIFPSHSLQKNSFYARTKRAVQV